MDLTVSQAAEIARRNGRSLLTHQYLVLPVFRPLKLFGKRFQVGLTNQGTLSPQTVLEVVTGMSYLAMAKEVGVDRELRALVAALSGERRLSKTTKEVVASKMGPFRDEVRVALAGNPVSNQLSLPGVWESFAKTYFNAESGTPLYKFLKEYARFENAFISALLAKRDDNVADASAIFESEYAGLESRLNRNAPGASLEGVLVLDPVVKAISASATSVDEKLPAIERLLRPDMRPIGNWLQLLCDSAGEDSLSGLVNAAARRRLLYRGRHISLSSLKAWSACSRAGDLMSRYAAEALMDLVPEHQRPSVQDQFFVSRLLTFLCELLQVIHPNPLRDWAASQQALLLWFREFAPRAQSS